MAFVLIPWLTTGSQLKDSDGVELVTFDANITETHTYSARATQHPVEDGVAFSDHVIIDPFTWSGDVELTDSPINEDDPEPDRARKLLSKLLALFESKEPFTLVTGLAVYENMIIERIDTPRDKDSGYSVPCSIAMKQLRIVESVTIRIPERLLRADVKDKGQGTVDAGQQGTDENEEVEVNNQSVWRGWLNGGTTTAPVDFGAYR